MVMENVALVHSVVPNLRAWEQQELNRKEEVKKRGAYMKKVKHS